MHKLLFLVIILPSLVLGGAVFSADFETAGRAYERGDFETALEEFSVLAHQGEHVPQFILGTMYSRGQGVPKNAEAAIKWLTLAAEQGLASAQNELGVIYKEGKGVPQNDRMAIKWASLAAKQGDAFGQVLLGAIYVDGKNIPRKYILAHMWWHIAASEGDAVAKQFRDKYAKKMSPVDIAEAQHLALKCRESNFREC